MGFKRMTRWVISIVICLLLPAVTLTANGRMIEDVQGEGRTHWVSDADELIHRHKGGCVLMADNRTFEAKALPLDIMFEERGRDLPFFIASRIINRAYARRHGYRFIVAQPETFRKNISERHSAWQKVPFIQQQLKCCCQWALFVDSDVYIRMDEHKLSIEQWLKLLDTPGYMSWIEKGLNSSLEEAVQLYLPKKATSILLPSDQSDGLIFIGPRDGDPRHGFGAKFNSFPDLKTCKGLGEFFNTGVMLFRDSPLTHKFLEDWWNEPDSRLFYGRPWEQPRFTEIAPGYRSHMGAIPYLEATGPQGRQIRHLWTVKGQRLKEKRMQQIAERHEQMHFAILSLAALQEEEDLARSQRAKREG